MIMIRLIIECSYVFISEGMKVKGYVILALLVPVILQGYCSAENVKELMAKMEAIEKRQVAMEKQIISMDKNMVAMDTQHKKEIGELSSKIAGW